MPKYRVQLVAEVFAPSAKEAAIATLRDLFSERNSFSVFGADGGQYPDGSPALSTSVVFLTPEDVLTTRMKMEVPA
jgi:hypothetical protein